MTYTVRPRGCAAWQQNISTETATLASYREAVDHGLSNIIIVDDKTGEIVAPATLANNDNDDDE